jgi:hypothetical protein
MNKLSVLLGPILVVAACGGGGQSGSLPVDPPAATTVTSSSAPTPTPTPTSLPIGYCTSVAPPALVYPASGATGIADGNFELSVSYPGNPDSAFTAPTLTAGSASTVTGGAWTAGSSGQWDSAIPALSANTTYTITVTNYLCSQTFALGSFTTK